MKKTVKILGFSTILFGIASQYSCNVADPEVQEAEKSTVEIVAMEQTEDLVIEEILDEVLMDLEDIDILKSESTCPLITKEKAGDRKFPRIITKDFGEGCMTNGGTERSGKIIITIYGPWLKEGSKRTVTFEDYTHKGISVTGERDIICKGVNDDGYYVQTISGVLNLTRPDSLVIERKSRERLTLITGFDDPDKPKEWFIEGSVEVSKSNGKNYVMHVKEPLHRIQACRWYQSGVKVLSFASREEANENNRRKINIDYSYTESNEDCDSFVLVWKGDQEAKVVDLSKKD